MTEFEHYIQALTDMHTHLLAQAKEVKSEDPATAREYERSAEEIALHTHKMQVHDYTDLFPREEEGGEDPILGEDKDNPEGIDTTMFGRHENGKIIITDIKQRPQNPEMETRALLLAATMKESSPPQKRKHNPPRKTAKK